MSPRGKRKVSLNFNLTYIFSWQGENLCGPSLAFMITRLWKCDDLFQDTEFSCNLCLRSFVPSKRCDLAELNFHLSSLTVCLNHFLYHAAS